MTLPFALSAVRRILFYKRDELTTDLICCDVEVEGPNEISTWSNHEESESWNDWLTAFGKLSGFDEAWHSKVSQPPFAQSLTVAYERGVVEHTASKD